MLKNLIANLRRNIVQSLQPILHPTNAPRDLVVAHESHIEKMFRQYTVWSRTGGDYDRESAEDAITKVYECLGKDAPAFVWCDSPPEAVRIRTLSNIFSAISNMGTKSFEDLIAACGQENYNRMPNAKHTPELRAALESSLRPFDVHTFADSLPGIGSKDFLPPHQIESYVRPILDRSGFSRYDFLLTVATAEQLQASMDYGDQWGDAGYWYLGVYKDAKVSNECIAPSRTRGEFCKPDLRAWREADVSLITELFSDFDVAHCREVLGRLLDPALKFVLEESLDNVLGWPEHKDSKFARMAINEARALVTSTELTPTFLAVRAALPLCEDWYPMDKVCLMVARPTELHFDAEMRLHRLGKPAIVYPNGWGAYCWRNQLVLGDTG